MAPLDARVTGAFLQAAEVWIPDPAGEYLVRAEGAYGPHESFGGVSGEHGFARGEGLPGRAWAEARPFVLTDLSDPRFFRAEAARSAGLGAAAALPVFSDGALKGVLVLFCGADPGHAGALELWHAGDAPDAVMRLEGGYYGADDTFREVSERTTFARGKGLPGGVWGARAPMLMRDLSAARGFLRAESAAKAGLTTGLGIPVFTPGKDAWAVTLLSAARSPVARRFEIWDVTAGRGGQKAVATLVDGLCDTEGALWTRERRIEPWQGPVGRALATAAPVVEANPATAPAGVRYEGMVALPIHPQGEVARVVAWFF
ncbi:GAF domain-containing protein [Amaricoccus solimangrovi]|nr:GAF domain-containing protein [Amaricoccus solimangrovi]